MTTDAEQKSSAAEAESSDGDAALDAPPSAETAAQPAESAALSDDQADLLAASFRPSWEPPAPSDSVASATASIPTVQRAASLPPPQAAALPAPVELPEGLPGARQKRRGMLMVAGAVAGFGVLAALGMMSSASTGKAGRALHSTPAPSAAVTAPAPVQAEPVQAEPVQARVEVAAAPPPAPTPPAPAALIAPEPVAAEPAPPVATAAVAPTTIAPEPEPKAEPAKARTQSAAPRPEKSSVAKRVRRARPAPIAKPRVARPARATKGAGFVSDSPY